MTKSEICPEQGHQIKFTLTMNPDNPFGFNETELDLLKLMFIQGATSMTGLLAKFPELSASDIKHLIYGNQHSDKSGTWGRVKDKTGERPLSQVWLLKVLILKGAITVD